MPELPSVVVVSVQGRSGLPPTGLQELEEVARVQAVARGDAPPLRHDEAVRLLADAEVVGLTPRVTPVLDDALLDALPRLRGVALHATGTDLYDLDVLERHGVALATLPAYSTTSVAEHAMAMLLSLSRRVHLGHDRSRGLVAPTTSLRGFELSGRTAGVLGLGRIGSRVAALASAFGMDVVASDPRRPTDPGVPLVGLPELLAASDVVVVACSRHLDDPPLLGRAELEAMRPGAVLVVVSRAAAVDADAACDLVRAGALRGFAVDDVVVSPERDGDLLAEGRVLQTGHSAWWSDEVLERGAHQWVQSLTGLVTGSGADLAVRPAGWHPPGTSPAGDRPA